MRTFYAIVISPVMLPFVMIFLATSRRNYIYQDLERWSRIVDDRELSGLFSYVSSFYSYFAHFPEFRSVFYYRVREAKLLSFLLKPMPTLYIYTKDIGPGLFIQHGFATIISASKIGKNCWINQQVTIGYTNKNDAPMIGDDVTINAGAIVIGRVAVEDGAHIGAGAVVTKDVERGAVVVGVPARTIRYAP